MWVAIFTFFLLIGYFIYGKSLEKNWEIDIYRDQSSWQEDESIISHFGFRYLQLAQFAVFLSFEALISVVYGYIYGLAYISWLIIGSVFFGGVLSYYGGMYALRHRGYSLNYIIKQKFGVVVHALSTIFLLGLIVFLLSDSFTSFNAVYSGILNLPEHLLLLYCGAVALFFCFCTPRQMAVLFSGVGIFAFICLILLFFGSKWQIRFVEYAAHNFAVNELKYAYPLSFFVVAMGSVNCLQGLQASLLAPMVKNEKVGRKIFFGASIFQAFFLIMLNVLIAAWNPDISKFYTSMLENSTPYTYLQNMAFGAGGKKATLLIFSLAITLFLSFVGAMARLARNLISETKIGAIKFLSGALAFLLVSLPMYGLKNYTSGFPYVVIYAQVAGIFSCYVLANYLKEHDKKYRHLIWPALLIGGALLAYAMLILFRFDLFVSDAAGMMVLLLPCLGFYWNNHKEKWQEKLKQFRLKNAEAQAIAREKREKIRLQKAEEKRKKQEELARKREQQAAEKKQKAEIKKQEKEDKKKASLALLSAQDETKGSRGRELELEKEIEKLRLEREKIDSQMRQIEQELEKKQSLRLLSETSESVIQEIEKTEEISENQIELPEIKNIDKTDLSADSLNLNSLIDEVENKVSPDSNPLQNFDFEDNKEDVFEFMAPAEKNTEPQNLPEDKAQKKKRNRKKKNVNKNQTN